MCVCRAIIIIITIIITLYTHYIQVYEMALSDWSFHVLSPIFTIHWGMQMKQRRPAWRKTQMDRNRRLFDVIHHELKAKYGLLNKSPVRWHPKPAASAIRCRKVGPANFNLIAAQPMIRMSLVILFMSSFIIMRYDLFFYLTGRKNKLPFGI